MLFIMLFRFKERGIEWIDLENPTPDEIREAARELDIGGRIIEELISPTPFPRLLHDDAVVLLVLHFPTEGAGVDPSLQEVDFVVGKDFVLTVRYEVVAPIHELRKLLETEQYTSLKNNYSAALVLELLFNHLFGSVRDFAAHSAKRLERIERELALGKDRATIYSIAEINRLFLHLESAIAGHETPLTFFLTELQGRSLFGATFAARANRILAERAQTIRLVETYRAIATEVRETNASLLNAKQNEIIKTLTMMIFVTAPLSLIGIIFAMETDYLPIVGLPGDFWIIIGSMVVLTLCFLAYFKVRRWL